MSKLCRTKCKSESDWLETRLKGIGGSEAAAIVGKSSWMSSRDLWELKAGLKAPKDISGNIFVEQGKRMEGAIRELYKAYRPEYKVSYHKYDLLFQKDRPWLFATLDGEITDDKKRKGILEVKTSTPQSHEAWSQWDCQIPQHYLIQILHQLLATGWDFVDLTALLINKDDDFFVRTYRFERADCEEDLAWLLSKEEAFWESVQNKILPPMTLVF